MESESDGNTHQTDEMDLLYDDMLDSDRNSESQTEMEFSSRSEYSKASNLDESLDLYGDLSTDPYGSSYTETNTDRDTTLESTALENTIEELDLYDDILTEEDAEQKQSYEEKCSEYESAVKLIEKLQNENKKLKENLMKQTTLSKNVQTNMSSLLVTARGELNRKDKEIKRLRMKPTFPHRTYTPGHQSEQDNQKGDRACIRDRLIKGKDNDETTTRWMGTSIEREENGAQSDNSRQSRSGKIDRSLNSRSEKDVFGRLRLNDVVKTGKEDELNIIMKDKNKRDRVRDKNHGDSSDNCNSSKQRKSKIESTKHDKHRENKRYEHEQNGHHRKKSERLELMSDKQDSDKKGNARKSNEKNMQRKEKEHERKSEKEIRGRKDEIEIRERKDEREKQERSINEDNISKERESHRKTKERDNDKDRTSRSANSETSSKFIPQSLEVSKSDPKVSKPLNSDCKVLDLREKLKQKRSTSGNKSTVDNIAETMKVKRTQIDTDRITDSVLPAVGSADKRVQLNDQSVIANKQKLNKEQESHNILKDREFLQSLKSNVRQKDLLKVSLDSNTNKDKSLSVERKPIAYTSYSKVTSKSDVRNERDVVKYDDFSPSSNSLFESPVLKKTDDIRNIREKTECQPVISSGIAFSESVGLLNKEMLQDTSATKEKLPQIYGPTDNMGVAFESENTQNKTSDVSVNEKNKSEICVDNDKTLNTCGTNTSNSLIVEQINKDLLNTIPIEETSGKKINKSAMESKADEMLSPNDRDAKENKAERRRSSEKKRRNSYRRVISETISSVTSSDKSPSVEEFLNNLRKECESTDNVSTCTSLSNVQSDCDMRHRSEGSVVHDELNMSDNKSMTHTQDDKVTEVMIRKIFCSKDGCSIKVNHLHPKSELNSSGVQNPPPEDIQKKSFEDPDDRDRMNASEMENATINAKDMQQSVKSSNLNDTSDSKSDDGSSNSELSLTENDNDVVKTEQFFEVIMEEEKKNNFINNVQNDCQERVRDSSKPNNRLCYEKNEKEIVTNSNSINKMSTDTNTIQTDVQDKHLKMSGVRKDSPLQDTNVLETLNSAKDSSQNVNKAEHVDSRKCSSGNESSSDSEDDSSYTSSSSGSSYSSSDSSGEESESERDSAIEEVHMEETLSKNSTTINEPKSSPKNACHEENVVTNEVQNDERSKILTQTSEEATIYRIEMDKHNSSCNTETEIKQHEKGIVIKVLEQNRDKHVAYKYTGLKQKDEGNEEILKDSVTEENQSKETLIAKTNEPHRKDHDLKETLDKSVVINPINIVSPDKNTSLQDKSFLLESLLCGIASVVNQKKEDERFLNKTLDCMNKDVSNSEGTQNKIKVIKGSLVETNNNVMGKIKQNSGSISETSVRAKDTDNTCPPSKNIDTDGKHNVIGTDRKKNISHNVDGDNKSTLSEIQNCMTDVALDVNNSEINKMATPPDKEWKPHIDSHESENITSKKGGNMDIHRDKTIETSIFGSTLSLSSDESSASSSSGSESDSDSRSGSSSESESSSYTSDSSPEDVETVKNQSYIKHSVCKSTEIVHEKVSALDHDGKSTGNDTEANSNETCDRNKVQALKSSCKVSDKTPSAVDKYCSIKRSLQEIIMTMCDYNSPEAIKSNKVKSYGDKSSTERKTREALVTNDKECKNKTRAKTANKNVSYDTMPSIIDQRNGSMHNNGFMDQDEMPKFLCETQVQEKNIKKRKVGKKDVHFVQSSPVITISNNKIVSTDICDSETKRSVHSENKACLNSKTYHDKIARNDQSVKQVKENVNDNGRDKGTNEKVNKDTRKDKTEDIKEQSIKSQNHVPPKKPEIKSRRLSSPKNTNSKSSQANARKLSSESVGSIETNIDTEKEKEMTLRLVGLSSASSKLSKKTSTFIMSPSERGNSNRKINKKVLSSEKQKTKPQPKFSVVASKSDKSVTGSILRLVSKSNERLKEKTGNEDKSKLASPKKKEIKTPLRDEKKSIASNSGVKNRIKLTFEHEKLVDHRDPASELTENLSKIAAHHERVIESRSTKKPLLKVKSPPLIESKKETVISCDSEIDCDLTVKEKKTFSKVQSSHSDNLRKKRRILSGSEKGHELPSLTAKSSSKLDIPSIEMIKRSSNVSSDTEDYDVDRLTHKLKVNTEKDKRNSSTSDNRSDKCVRRSQCHTVYYEETLTKDKNTTKGNDCKNKVKELQSFEDLIENYEKHLVKSHKTRKLSKHSETSKAVQKHCSDNLLRKKDISKNVHCDSTTGSSLKNKSNRLQKSVPSRDKIVQSSKDMIIEKKRKLCQKESDNSMIFNVDKAKVNQEETKGEKAKHVTSDKTNYYISDKAEHDFGDKAEHATRETLSTDTDDSDSDVGNEDTDSMVRAIFGSSESSEGRKSKSVSSSERPKCSSVKERQHTSKKEGDITMNLEEKLKELYASTRLERENLPKHKSENTTKVEKIMKKITHGEQSSIESTKNSNILKSLSPKENQKKGRIDKIDVRVKEPEKENEEIKKYDGKSIAAFILDDADTLDGIDYEDDLSFGLEETAAFNDECDTMPVNNTEHSKREEQLETSEDGEVSSGSESVDEHVQFRYVDRNKQSVSDFRNEARGQVHIEIFDKTSRPKILLRPDKAFSPIKFPSSAVSPNTKDDRGNDSSSYKRESQAKRKYRSDSNSSIEDVETFGISTKKSNRPTVKGRNYRITPDVVDKKRSRRSPIIRMQRSRSPNLSTRRRSKSPQCHSSRRSRSISPRRHKTSIQYVSSSRSKRRSRSGSYDKSRDNYRRHRERNRDQKVAKMSSNGSSSEEENIIDSRFRSSLRAGDRIGKHTKERQRSNSLSSCYDSPKGASKHRHRRESKHPKSGSDSEGRYRDREYSIRYKHGNSDSRKELTHRSRKDSSFSKDRHSSKYHSRHKRRYVSSSDDEYVLVKKTELKRRRSERSVTPTIFDSEYSNEDDRISKDLNRKKNSSEKENVSSPFSQKKGKF